MNSLHLPLKKHQIGPVLLMLVMCVIFFAVQEYVIAWFDYSRAGVNKGEIWRFFSAHLLHTNGNHLLLNGAGLLLLWALHGDYYNAPRIAVVFFSSALIIALGIHLFTPELSRYVGLSGVLHSLFVWGALQDIQHKRKSGYLLLVGVAIKIIAEQIQGPDQRLGDWIDAIVAIDAHLYGALAGIIGFLITQLFMRRETVKRR
ncbi:rhombosortase [Alteromonas sediminis]|uniref:Rhombosortase n=1 Tax=Alteromonas sediminis TaxID=2259342 RepID=A0A3N5Y3Q2_9ALTE|nr:rhombosortase [Alteromonas sediminis]RPJ67486.1 rhombosortase [Alteromonas sediminis]